MSRCRLWQSRTMHVHVALLQQQLWCCCWVTSLGPPLRAAGLCTPVQLVHNSRARSCGQQRRTEGPLRRVHLTNNQTPTAQVFILFLSIIIFTVPTSDLWDLPDGHWLACLPFFCVCRIVLISGRRSFYSVFSVLPYRDCSQAGYVSSSMPKLVTSSSLCSLFPPPRFPRWMCSPLTGACIAMGCFWWMHFHHKVLC